MISRPPGCRWNGIYTNTTQVDAYRGAGRPEAIYVLERVMDRAARELGVDPLELRRRNFIKPAAFPYGTVTGETYDVGDFDKVLGRAVEAAESAGDSRPAAPQMVNAASTGALGSVYYIGKHFGRSFRRRGSGVSGGWPGEHLCRHAKQTDRGMKPSMPSSWPTKSGIPAENIQVIQGDSDRIAAGGGTGGSRSVTTQANANAGGS